MNMKKIMQKIAGIALIALNVLGVKLTADGTAAIVLIPLGLWLLFSKEQILEI